MKSMYFSEIYQEHAEMVYRFLLRMCQDEDLAEDLMQDTFLKAIENIGTFDMRCKLSTWLCQIAKNTYLDYLRKKKNQTDVEFCEEFIRKVRSVGKSYLLTGKRHASSYVEWNRQRKIGRGKRYEM